MKSPIESTESDFIVKKSLSYPTFFSMILFEGSSLLNFKNWIKPHTSFFKSEGREEILVCNCMSFILLLFCEDQYYLSCSTIEFRNDYLVMNIVKIPCIIGSHCARRIDSLFLRYANIRESEMILIPVFKWK